MAQHVLRCNNNIKCNGLEKHVLISVYNRVWITERFQQCDNRKNVWDSVADSGVPRHEDSNSIGATFPKKCMNIETIGHPEIDEVNCTCIECYVYNANI